MARGKWIHIGDVGVDTGQLVIGDPCNLEGMPRETQVFEGIAGYVDGASWTVGLQPGFGDGLYPVFARVEKINGQEVITDVTIHFIHKG